jgi:hypothetical protein
MSQARRMAANDPTFDAPRPWSQLRQDIGVIVWCGFLAACFATMLFFAIFDPVHLMRDDATPAWLADRRTGYALGFFFFWFVTTISATLTAWLIDTRSNSAAQPDKS